MTTLTPTNESEMIRFFELTPDLVCIASKDGYLKNFNKAVTDKLGYSREELLSRPIASLILPEDRERTRVTREEMLRGQVLINFENRYVTKSDSIVWLQWTAIYIPDREVVFAIAKDITPKKKAQREIEDKYKQFKALASHFKASLEKDKKNLAAELHEQLAQLAWIVKVDLNWLEENHISSDENVRGRIAHATSVTEMLINSIRNMSYSIGPGMLDDMGLNETIRTLCDEFTKLNGIPCSFETTLDDQRLSREVQLDLYRICQESLKNVAAHAGANSVSVLLQPQDDKILLSIIDDGKGFELEQIDYTPGITGMRERIASVNGQLIVESEKGKGTRVRVLVQP